MRDGSRWASESNPIQGAIGDWVPPFPHGFPAFPHDQDRSRHRDRGDVAMVTAILTKVTEVETW